MPGLCAYVDRDTPEIFGAQVVGYIKGKSAIAIAGRFSGKGNNFSGQNFWAGGY
jgi:putative transposase